MSEQETQGVDVPERPEITQAFISDWYATNQDLAKLRNKEAGMRRTLHSTIFRDGHKIGTNNARLPADQAGQDYMLKSVVKLNYRIDKAVLQNISNELWEKHQVRLDDLINWEPKLREGAYKGLSDEAKALFNQCVTTSESLPSIEINPIKSRPRSEYVDLTHIE